MRQRSPPSAVVPDALAGARVIVDLDGTLLDTRRRHHAVYCEAAGVLGQAPLPLPDLWRAKRRGVGWDRLLGGADKLGAFLEVWKRRIEAPDMLALDRLQPGALRALRRLRGRGLRTVLLTARRDPGALERQLRDLGVRDSLSEVVAVGSGPKSPPPGSPILRWIGDTEADIEGARAAGVPVTAVTNGIRTPGLLARSQPDDIAPSFSAAVTRMLSAPEP